MVYTIKETESLSMKGGKPQLSTAVLEDCKTEPSSMKSNPHEIVR